MQKMRWIATVVAAYAIDLGVTFPSIRNKVATLLFVAFLWPSVFCFLRKGPSSDSASKDSHDVGDVKIAQYVLRNQ